MESYCKILIVEDEFLLRQGIKKSGALGTRRFPSRGGNQ